MVQLYGTSSVDACVPNDTETSVDMKGRGYFPIILWQGREWSTKGRNNQIHPTDTNYLSLLLLSGVPDYFGRNEISSGGDLSHYSSASLY